MTIVIDDKLGIWTIYHQPELPEYHYRARLFVLDQPTTQVLGADSLEEIRKLVNGTSYGLIRFERNEADPPEVVETWL